MPIYDYCCDACNKWFDEYQPISEFDAKRKPKCPVCKKKGKVRRVFVRPTKVMPKEEEPIDKKWQDVPVPDVPIKKDGVVAVDQTYPGLL
jgi:putative FmdB family regulatory protein